MSDVEFEDDGSQYGAKSRLLYSRIELSNAKPPIVQFLLRKHIVKSERQANMLIIAGVVFLLFAAYFIYANFNYQNKLITVEEFIQYKIQQNNL